MRNLYISILIFCLFSILSTAVVAQADHFKDIAESSIKTEGKRTIFPQKYRTVVANTPALKSFLWSLPSESSLFNRHLSPEITLPMPNGKSARFHVWESTVMEAGLQAQFPEIRTFCGQGIDDPYATIRLDFNPYFGFHGQVLTINGNYYLDPYARGDIDHYISYFTADNIRSRDFVCEVNEEYHSKPEEVMIAGPCRGTQLRTYRLAIACTGEYAVAVGGTTANALHAAIVTSANRINGVYEKELSVRLILVDNNTNIEFLSAASDPFNGNNNAGTLITESQTVITANIGTANYDIGHTFSTGGGGLAGLGVVCNSSQKARGITGSPSPVGDNYDIDYVAHEMGHQFGGNHSFNSSTSSCSGNRTSATAYEVGAGTTIMGYAGICGSDNTQPHSDATFHAISFDELSSYVNAGGASCGTVSATGNNLPVITAMDLQGSNIPLLTPFTLTGSATDIDGDAISYCWEEWDKGASTTWNGGAFTTTSPIFKSRLPKTIGSRTFPDIAVILANYPTNPTSTMGGLKGETLPSVARTMNFRLTVRDNRAGGGGIVSGGSGCQTGYTAAFPINSIAGTGPFKVTYPNGGETFPGGTSPTATWDIAGTNVAPINTAKVKILLSTDGGNTFPTVLLDSTDNDGSEPILLPAVITTTARIKVQAIGNVYFDISNANFSITQAAADFSFNTTSQVTIPCGSNTAATVTLGTSAIGGFSTPINLTATGNPAGTSVAFDNNPLTPGNSTVVSLDNIASLGIGTYIVTVTGIAGTVTKTATLTFQVVAGPGPSFLSQPTSVELCAGENTSFSASVTGATTLQWQVSSNGGNTWSNINDTGVFSGSNTNTLTITGTPGALNANQFHLLAITQCGTSTSNSASLLVNTSPAINTQLQNASVCEGFNHTFSVDATGSGLTYQWQISTNGCNSYSDINGATNSTLIIANVTAALNNNCYRVIINGICPGGPLNSNGATLSVTSTTAITGNPANLTICGGDNASFNVTVSGSASYQWQISTNGGTNWNIINGATSATLSLGIVNISQDNTNYRVIVSGCTPSPLTSSGATLTVNTPVSITTQPANVNTCINNGSFSVLAFGTNIGYQWQTSADGGNTWSDVSNGSNFAGASSSVLVITGAIQSMDGNIFRVNVTGSCNTGGLLSQSAVFSISKPITINDQPANTTVCLNQGSNGSFSINATGTGITYQWQVSTNGGTSWVNINGSTASTYTTPVLTTANNNNTYRVVTNGYCTTNLNSNAAVLNVIGSVISVQPQNVRICAPGPANFAVSANAGATGYQWQVSTNGGNTWTDITTNGTAINYATPALTSADNGKIYRVIVSTASCGNDTSATATLALGSNHNVTISAAPNTTVTPQNPAVINASTLPTGNYTYQWYYNGLPVSDSSRQALTVRGSEVGNYYATSFNAATNCIDTSNAITITANPTTTLFIYPNPNKGLFNVVYYSSNSGITRSITVYDAKGAKVYSENVSITGPYQDIKVNLNNLSAGVYMIDLRSASGVRIATGKVVIE